MTPQTVADLLQAELDEIALDVGRAFIAHAPKPAAAEQARTIEAFIKLAAKRPAVARALAVSLTVPAATLELAPQATVEVPEQASAPEVAEQIIEAVEQALAPVEEVRTPSGRKSRATGGTPGRKPVQTADEARAKKKVINDRARESRVEELYQHALDLEWPPLSAAPSGETAAEKSLRVAALRRWGLYNKHTTSTQGPVPAAVYRAYDKARISRRRVAEEGAPIFGAVPTTTKIGSLATPCTRPDKQRYISAKSARVAMELLLAKGDEVVREGELLDVYMCPASTSARDRHFHYGHTRTAEDRFRAVSERDEAMLERPLNLEIPNPFPLPLSIDGSPAPTTTSVAVAL